MSWIFLSLLAPLIWATVNTIDKFMLTRWICEPIVPVLITGIVDLILSLILFTLLGIPNLSLTHTLLALSTGILNTLILIFYFKAAKIEDISRVVPLFYISPLFVLLLATIFRAEYFTLPKYIGIFALVSGAILISSRNIKKLAHSKAFYFMVLAAISLASLLVITDYLLEYTDYWSIFATTRFSSIFLIIPLYFWHYPKLITTIKKNGTKVIAVISANELLNLTAILLITIAIAKGPVTLINALSAIQPFYVFLITIILSLFFPKIIKEELDKKSVITKLIAIALIFVGVFMIT